MLNEQISKAAEIKVVYKTKVAASDRPRITCSQNAVDVLRPFYEDYMELKEAFHVIYLNRANRVIAVIRISEGSATATTVDPKHVMQPAILLNATGMILCHNHPSGNLKPSEADNHLTSTMKSICKMFDIQLLDHIILTLESFYSYADEAEI